jgi:tetratricopeptide (TPR) repeat protein
VAAARTSAAADLSRAAGLFVVARNSSFAYRDKSIDVRVIARELGVRYIVEGSARRAAGRVRINVQLIDALGGGNLWAERFDRELSDIFAVQDEVVARIVEALVGRLAVPQIERKRPTNLEAYDLCMRGRTLVLQSPEGTREARLLFERAVALEPTYAEAHRWLAHSLNAAWTLQGEPIEPNRLKSLAEAKKAVELDPNDAGAHSTLANLLMRERQWTEAEGELTTALALDPNYADAWAHFSELMVLKGRPADAIAHIQTALRFNPFPPGWYYWMLGQAQYLNRQYEQAVKTLQREETYRMPSRRTLAASLAQLGNLEEARREAELFLASNPKFTIRSWKETMAFADEAASEHFVSGYRKAGLPEQ